MFVRQAARQIELFTGKTPDLAVMRDIMRKALSPLTKAFDPDEGQDEIETKEVQSQEED
jgi:3-dehydroquinate dehydratase/shikimate dehydrogenase